MHHRLGRSSGPAGNMPEEDALGAAYHSHWQQQEEARHHHRHYRRQPQQQQYVCYYVLPDTVHHGEASAAEEGERGASAGYYYDHTAGAYYYDAAQQVWQKAAMLIDSDDDSDSRYHEALACHPYASTAYNSGGGSGIKAGRQQEDRGFSTRDRLGGRAAAASASKKGGKSYFAKLMGHIMAHTIMIRARRGLGANNPSSWGGFADDKILKNALFILFDQHRKLPTFGGLQDLLREALQMYTSGLTGTGDDAGGSVLGTTLASLAGGSELAEGERSMRLIVSAVDRALGYYKERGGKRRHLLMVVGAVVLVSMVLLFRRRRVGPVLVHQ
ncbi:hypothetical protein EV182_003799 [Spiromyces aspiralis]|uniref:Uncharacterized protein n=1 Tax=Spiromyces aspiralis TaxID=68401 RepID=A0ACC1HC72_9FUNG|nr:hypothetical protein EV182_003799 [Spiromyces aspiralis]